MDGSDSPQSRDPAIKLFGREIPLRECQISAKPKSMETNCRMMELQKSLPLPSTKEEQKASTEPSRTYVNNSNSSKSKEDRAEAKDTEQEKVFKKPDKILPCPRCNSLDTKFCYFNNYNVNQPRHFCKNCQRYWTAGGTMRNVPVGAGRRKNKQFPSQYRQMLVSPDGSPITKMETPDSANNNQTGMVLKFGSEVPLCDNVLQLRDLKKHEGQDQEVSAPGSSSLLVSCIQNNDVPVNSLPKEQTLFLGGCNDTDPQNSLPYCPVPPWGFPLNPTWNNAATVIQSGGNSNSVQFRPGPVPTIPGVLPQNIPLQFVPVSYIACRPMLGNLPVSASNGDYLSPTSSTSNSGGSPALGKHAREATSVVEETQTEKYSLVSRSLRIDDPSAIPKSSPLWATTTLGTIPNHESKCAIFKGLEPKVEGTHVLEANPAAHSRSNTFQEGT